MKRVCVNRDKLLERVKENRDLHLKEFEKAYGEFREAGIAAIKEMLEEFTADETDSFHIRLSAPESHEQAYDDAIAMLEMSCDDEIELDHNEAQNLLLNHWSWADDIGQTRAMYANYLKKV